MRRSSFERSRSRARPWGLRATLVTLAGLGALAGCSSAAPPASPKPIAPLSPPKDDGHSALGGAGGDAHAAALEQLRISPIAPKGDKQGSVLVPLPDADHWTRVRFMTVKSLVGFRYGKEHHAIVAAFVTHVEDNEEPSACGRSFESWAMPMIEAFEVDLKHDPPAAFAWAGPQPDPKKPKKVAIVDVDSLVAKTATLISRDSYAAAWTTYPAWPKACLVVGVAVPMREDDGRAREVRDRFVKEVFPKLVVTAATEPKEAY